MKKASLSLGLALLSFSTVMAHAALVFERDTAAFCEILSTVRSHAPAAELVITDTTSYKIPAKDSATVKTEAGNRTYIFGVGDVLLQGNFKILDINKNIVQKPVTVKFSFARNGDRRSLVYSAELFNPFTGKVEVLDNSSFPQLIQVSGSFHYVEIIFSSPKATTPGELVNSGLRCFFLP